MIIYHNHEGWTVQSLTGIAPSLVGVPLETSPMVFDYDP